MTKLIAGMTVSLDGFIADCAGNADALYLDLVSLQDTPYMEAMAAETGAVLMGRGAFEMAEDPDAYADSYELQRPIFVVTHHPPAKHPKENDKLTFTFITTGLESAVAQAKQAADRTVQCIGGAGVIGQLMGAGLVDELCVDVMPVILGNGRRFLDGIDRSIELEKVAVAEQGQRTSIRFRVRRP